MFCFIWMWVEGARSPKRGFECRRSSGCSFCFGTSGFFFCCCCFVHCFDCDYVRNLFIERCVLTALHACCIRDARDFNRQHEAFMWDGSHTDVVAWSSVLALVNTPANATIWCQRFRLHTCCQFLALTRILFFPMVFIHFVWLTNYCPVLFSFRLSQLLLLVTFPQHFNSSIIEIFQTCPTSYYCYDIKITSH